nr:MAG TPA: Neck appendage protein [Caudoviricetes sp.]
MIYLFDKDEKLIKIIRKPAIKTAIQKYSLTKERYVSDRLTVEMKSLNDDELEKVEYMAIQTMEDAHTFHYFYVAQKSSENLTTLIGVQSGIEELRKSPVFDKRPKNAFAKNVINDLLKGTNWQARFVGETTQRSTSFYYISVFDALKKACEVWDLEMQFFVEMNGNRIGARYIDFKRKIGQAVGKRVVYGHNALQILQEVERTNIFTALVGRGKGEQVSSAEESGKQANGFGRKITFEDVVWSTASGKPINKPKGQKYVELPAMTKLYGIKNADGSMRPKIGFVEFAEEENPEVLIERTYKALVDAARPQLTLKTSSVYLRGAKVGDTIRVVRHDKKLDYDTRIFEITFNRLNDQSSDIKLGDRIGESNEAKAQTIAEKVVDDFVSNEFSDFVQKLPDFLPSPDGFNNNWYGAEDPTVKYPGKVLINDIWFKPDPEHEGHKIMLRWTGEVWDEILRSYDKELLTKRISEEIANFDKTFQSVNEQNKKKIDEILQSSGASTLLAQEAKRIGLDSVAKLEEFKRQATSAHTALSGDLDILKRTIANDIRPKQEQVTAEIEKQVKALIQTKNELAGVKSAQATYEETTTRRLTELTNLADGKASKSELAQTAEELASKIASVRVGGVNLFKGSKDFSGSWANLANWTRESENYQGMTVMSRAGTWLGLSQAFETKKGEVYTLSFYIKSSINSDRINVYFTHASTNQLARTTPYMSSVAISNEWQRTSVTFEITESGFILPRIERFNTEASVYVAGLKLERGNISTDYSEAPEDIEGQISIVESSFRQRADALDAGVSRLTEGLRTKADISSLNVTAESIRQSVKSLETSTQNELNQKLNLAEFEVRASGIHQEILNATKDKADKTLVLAEAGKIREEFSNLRVGGVNLLRNTASLLIGDRSKGYWMSSSGGNGRAVSVEVLDPPQNMIKNMIRIIENTNGGNKDLTQFVRLLVGEKYTISCYARVASDSSHANVNLLFRSWANDTDLNRKFQKSISHTNWQKYSFTFTADEIENLIQFGQSGAGIIEICAPKIESGTLATDWSPAPEDTDGLITEAKATFDRTAQGLRTDLSAIQEYVNKDGQRQEVLRRYTREESAQQANAVRELVARNYVGKSDYQEDVKGLERRLSAISTQTNNDIATKIAQYKQTVDGQFFSITSQIAGKANQTDFQRVEETSQLYERIIGNNDNSISNNIARMALTNQLFQVEVSKASASGRNLFLNSLFKRDLRDKYSTYKLYDDNAQTKGQLAVSIDSENQFRGVNTLKIVSTFNGKIDNQKITFNIGGNSRTGRDDELKNKSVRFSFWAKSTVANTKFYARSGYRGWGREIPISTDWKFYDVEFVTNENLNATSELILHVFTAATVWIAFPKIEIGTVATPFSEAPEDTDEAIRTVQSQLSGSWAVQNLTSAGDLISGINLGANGHNRFVGKLTHITGETLIDNAVIKSAMIDKLKTANFEAGSVTTVVLDAEAVTAEKLKVDQAFFNKLVANEAYLSQLFAKQAFITRVQSVTLDASQIKTGVLTGGRIHGGSITGSSIAGGTITGGTITGSSISGATLTGHTKIQLGTYGSFDTVDGGLQINVPRTSSSKDGLGVQFIGSYGRGANVPYGLYVYKDSDLTTSGTGLDSDDFLMTVNGYINAKGIGWLKMGKGSVNGKTTGTIGLWNSDNVSLSFGGSGNDIYYSYNGTAYSLWSVVNQHFSDRRLKDNIVACEHKALDYIQQFRFKEYDWRKQEDRPQQAHTKIGLIAQEVQAVDPTLVYENGDTLNLDNLRLTNIALKAIQELALENRKLTHRLENLENECRTA